MICLEGNCIIVSSKKITLNIREVRVCEGGRYVGQKEPTGGGALLGWQHPELMGRWQCYCLLAYNSWSMEFGVCVFVIDNKNK